LRMLVEATLDFPEEEIDFLEKADARGRLARLQAQLDQVLSTARQGALLRDGLRVVLAGQPNVGKSSLLNALAGAELAIVTPVPGTTRDRVSETIQIEGVPVHVTDTAGLRDTEDEVERIGVERSWASIREADAIVFLHDLSRLDDPAYQAGDRQIRDALQAQGARRDHWIEVYNKADLVAGAGGTVPAISALDTPKDVTTGRVSGAEATAQGAPLATLAPDGAASLHLSARTGAGLDTLRLLLLERAGWQRTAEDVTIARSRHLDALRRAAEHLTHAAAHAAMADAALDLFAEELRLAHVALGEITGQVSADDLLGEIFGRFCIGK